MCKFTRLLPVVCAFLVSSCGGGAESAPDTVPTTTTFNISTAHAPTSYTINGLQNPTLVIQRGVSYTFNLSASGHPFYIMSVQGTNTTNAYNSGVTNNGAQTGVLTFTVPMSAPNTLYYDCSTHASMTGLITVTN
jgi:hypothetical protein